MRVIGRLLLILAVVLPVCSVVAMGEANGEAAVVNCMHWKDDMWLAPGATQNPSGQQVTAKGKLYGCNKSGGGAVFTANLSMSNATCSNLAMSGNAQFDWTNGSHSSAFLNFQPQSLEPNKVFITGTITSGTYQGLIVQAWLRFTQVYSGSGPNCSANNPLKKIDFTNSQSFQLLIPHTRPSNPPPPTNPPPTNPPPSNPPPSNPPPKNPPPTNPTVIIQNNPPPTFVIINRFPRRRHVIIVRRHFPTGTLAFTGSSSGKAAMLGLEALLLGGALAFLNPDKARRAARFGRRGRASRKFLRVTLPPR